MAAFVKLVNVFYLHMQMLFVAFEFVDKWEMVIV